MDFSLFQWLVLGGLAVIIFMLQQKGKAADRAQEHLVDLRRQMAGDDQDDEDSIEARRARQR